MQFYWKQKHMFMYMDTYYICTALPYDINAFIHRIHKVKRNLCKFIIAVDLFINLAALVQHININVAICVLSIFITIGIVVRYGCSCTFYIIGVHMIHCIHITQGLTINLSHQYPMQLYCVIFYNL